jgi:hypothetical protein
VVASTRIRSRCGSGAPLSKVSGMDSAAASGTTPRVPAHDTTAGTGQESLPLSLRRWMTADSGNTHTTRSPGQGPGLSTAEIGDAVAEVAPGGPQLRDVRGGAQRFGGQVRVHLVPFPDAVVGLLHLTGARARSPPLPGQPLINGSGLVPGGLKVVKGVLRNPGHRREPSVMDVQAREPRLDVGSLQQADGEFLAGPGGEVHLLQQLAAVPQGRAVVQPPLHLISAVFRMAQRSPANAPLISPTSTAV